MKKLLLAAALSTSIALGGCASGGSTGNVSSIQQAAVLACGFLPTAQTVADILAAGNSLISTVSAVAQAICAAVGTKGVRKGGAAPTVNGVVIHGKFVN